MQHRRTWSRVVEHRGVPGAYSRVYTGWCTRLPTYPGVYTGWYTSLYALPSPPYPGWYTSLYALPLSYHTQGGTPPYMPLPYPGGTRATCSPYHRFEQLFTVFSLLFSSQVYSRNERGELSAQSCLFRQNDEKQAGIALG